MCAVFTLNTWKADPQIMHTESAAALAAFKQRQAEMDTVSHEKESSTGLTQVGAIGCSKGCTCSPLYIYIYLLGDITTMASVMALCFSLAMQAQEQALKQLNLLKNGTEYPDRSILDGFTEDNLRTRIGEL